MLKKLFQPDKRWYDEKSRRLEYAAQHMRQCKSKETLDAIMKWHLKWMKYLVGEPDPTSEPIPGLVFDEPNYQMNTMMGDLPFQK